MMSIRDSLRGETGMDNIWPFDYTETKNKYVQIYDALAKKIMRWDTKSLLFIWYPKIAPSISKYFHRLV
jgi:23S rRNA A2030 N6-methylase RlmJ